MTTRAAPSGVIEVASCLTIRRTARPSSSSTTASADGPSTVTSGTGTGR